MQTLRFRNTLIALIAGLTSVQLSTTANAQVLHADDVHITTGNSPLLRLVQDGTSGFTPQTWDLSGNETNFFLRDATNGSTLPFRVRPGAPSSALDIAASGNVGIGTGTPLQALHVKGTTGDTQLLVEETGAAAGRTVIRVLNNGPTRLQLNNTQTDDQWTFNATHNSFRFAHSGSGAVMGTELSIFENGNATLSGVLTQNSDVNAKTNIASLDTALVLAKVMELPVSEWSYKDDIKIRHIGPMAQDFYKSFGLGNTEKGITSIDTGGVALAAIQGIKKEQDSNFQRLEKENQSLQNEISELKALVQQLLDANQ